MRMAKEDRRMPTTALRRTLTLAGLEVPVVELTGAGDGPRLTVLAGVHGCEYAPMAALRQWTRALEERELRGSLAQEGIKTLGESRLHGSGLVEHDHAAVDHLHDVGGTDRQRHVGRKSHPAAFGGSAEADALRRSQEARVQGCRKRQRTVRD